MRVADCPKCGVCARPAGNTAYCATCGWNRLSALEDVRQSLLVLPLVFSVFFVISLLTKRWFGIVLISGLCLLWIAVSAVKLVLQKRELLRSELRSPVIESVTPQVAGGQNEHYVVPSRFSHFSSLSVPRKLKMKRVFRCLAILLPIIALAFTDVTYSLLIPPHKAPDDPQWGARMALLTVGIYGAIIWGGLLERRRRRLLQSGDIRFALVLKSDAGKGTLLPGITYRFLAKDGKEIEEYDHDWTDSYHQGMVVPVFVQSHHPENHVAMCASFYDVI